MLLFNKNHSGMTLKDASDDSLVARCSLGDSWIINLPYLGNLEKYTK